jgi:hypothetical protein
MHKIQNPHVCGLVVGAVCLIGDVSLQPPSPTAIHQSRATKITTLLLIS